MPAFLSFHCGFPFRYKIIHYLLSLDYKLDRIINLEYWFFYMIINLFLKSNIKRIWIIILVLCSFFL